MNLQCNKIDDYIDGKLDNDSQAAFVEHLETCDLCQLEIQIESELDGKVATAWGNVDAPASLRCSLQSKLASKPEPNCDSVTVASKPFYRTAVAACTAVAAMIILILSVTLSRSPENEGRELTGIQIDDGNTAEPLNGSHKIATEPMQSPLATVIQNKNSNSIFVPQASSASYTIVKVYPTISTNSKLNETFTGENQ